MFSSLACLPYFSMASRHAISGKPSSLATLPSLESLAQPAARFYATLALLADCRALAGRNFLPATGRPAVRCTTNAPTRRAEAERSREPDGGRPTPRQTAGWLGAPAQ